MLRKLLLFTGLIVLSLSGKSQPVNFSWAKSMGGKGSYDGYVGLAKDASGNLYVTGEFSGTRDFGSFSLTALGYTDVFVAKFNAGGTCLWAVRGGSSFSAAYGGKVVCNGNDVYVTGNFTNIIDFNGLAIASSGGKDLFVAGFDATNGTCLWIDKAGSTTFDDISYGMTAANGGGFYLCGTFTGNATFGPFQVSSSSIVDYDIFVAKYTSNGTCSWVTPIGSTGSDIAYGIDEDFLGDILVTGTYEGTVNFGSGFTKTAVGYADMFLAKFNPGGVLTWVFSGGGDNTDIGYSVSTDAAGNIVTAGFIADTATFGTINVNNNGNIQVCTAKFNYYGNCQWVRTGGNIIDDIAYGVVCDASGSSYVTGYVSGNGMFGTTPITGVSGNDGFVVKYDPSGTLKWLTKIGGLSQDRGKTIIEDASGFVFAVGDFQDNVAFGSTGLYTDPGVTGIYLTKVGGGTVGLNETEKAPFRVYPNPASEVVFLDLNDITDDAFTLSLFSADGKQVHNDLLSSKDAHAGFRYEIGKLPAGNYMLHLETSKGDFNVPLMISE